MLAEFQLPAPRAKESRAFFWLFYFICYKVIFYQIAKKAFRSESLDYSKSQNLFRLEIQNRAQPQKQKNSHKLLNRHSKPCIIPNRTYFLTLKKKSFHLWKIRCDFFFLFSWPIDFLQKQNILRDSEYLCLHVAVCTSLLKRRL